MPQRGPIPRTDGDFNAYVNAVVPYLTDDENNTRLRVSTDHQTSATQLLQDWNRWYALNTDPNTRTKTITDTKNNLRESLTDLLREIYDDIPQSALTPADRNTLHLPERAKPSAAPIPHTAPEGRIDTSQRLQHTIHFHNAGDVSRAKPAGVRGCQIWYATAEDATLEDLSFLGLDTKSPYVAHWPTAASGKSIYYWLRWENTRGEAGPWSEVVKATVTG